MLTERSVKSSSKVSTVSPVCDDEVSAHLWPSGFVVFLLAVFLLSVLFARKPFRKPEPQASAIWTADENRNKKSLQLNLNEDLAAWAGMAIHSRSQRLKIGHHLGFTGSGLLRLVCANKAKFPQQHRQDDQDQQSDRLCQHSAVHPRINTGRMDLEDSDDDMIPDLSDGCT